MLRMLGPLKQSFQTILNRFSIPSILQPFPILSASTNSSFNINWFPTNSNNVSLPTSLKRKPGSEIYPYYLVRPEYKPTRNPIVLCHGLYGFDKIGFKTLPMLQVHYWQGVAEALSQLGCEVYVTKVSPTGSIAERAHQLDQTLSQILPNRTINLVGHSMGGLDSRYLISSIKPKNYTIHSLTTVATPHRGSHFMNWCRDHLKVGKLTSEEAIEDPKKRQVWFEKLMSVLDTPAYANLTTDYMEKKFNPSNLNDPNVAYYSYNAYIEQMPMVSALHLPWFIIQSQGLKNDGLVALNSANWGQLVETVNANHFDLVVRFRWLNAIAHWIGCRDARFYSDVEMKIPDALLKSPETDFDNVDFYMRLVSFLYRKGF